MNTTTVVSLAVMAVLLVLYMMRRKARLTRESDD
jgi:multisubunit Na+/H+ antiporter MnhC subunit